MLLVTSSYLLLVVRPGAPSSVLAPSSDARSPYYLLVTGILSHEGRGSNLLFILAQSTEHVPPHVSFTRFVPPFSVCQQLALPLASNPKENLSGTCSDCFKFFFGGAIGFVGTTSPKYYNRQEVTVEERRGRAAFGREVRVGPWDLQLQTQDSSGK